MEHVIRGLVLVLCFAGCTQRPPPPANGKLGKEELAWYERRAVSWFEDQLEARRRGGIAEGPTILGVDEHSYDRAIPVKSELSTDHTTVTVSLPKKVTKYEEEWIRIDVDTRSGKVKTAGMLVVEDRF